MILEVYLILGSLVLIIAMVSFRCFVSNSSDINPNSLLSKSDDFIGSVILWIFKSFRRAGDSTSHFIKSLPHNTLEVFHIFLVKLSKRTKRWVDLIKGNNIPRSKGAVSLYLQNIEKEEK